MAPPDETLTAALRRLGDEHASGLLSVATPGRDVVLELADGVPVALGPVHDVSDRVGPDAPPELVAAAIIDGLVDRTVAAIVGGGGEWAWDVASNAARVPVPPGLAAELSRRAVDAAQAMAGLTAETVLEPAWELAVTGEVGDLHRLLDGERTLADLAELLDVPLPTVTTRAAALARAGAATDRRQAEETSASSWSDAVAGHDDEDDDDDEPELWVMTPPEPEPEPEPVAEPVAETTSAPPPATPSPAASPTTGRESPSTPASPQPADAAPAPTGTREASATDGASDPSSAEPQDVAASSSLVDDGGGGWADTSWLDELDDDRPTRPPPVLGDDREANDDARNALTAMLGDLHRPAAADDDAPDRRQAPAPAPVADASEPVADPDPPTERRAPKAEPAQVAEFLRELSRLALDED